ncbi:dihydrodipicolinate synthase family protein [Oceanobacillus senegalensis]|uniref:dihydrodipicolinate synthase family protein n=1 Tax=Oceanobacillus senegalensis TaxID=1936063 RepID=UPI000A30B3D2|nr:dihydrodipicolinate synthase family protein [Oceanobacillus senegalensis]
MLKQTFHIAVTTAFFEDESLNSQGTIAHIKDLYKQGVKSVLVSGSTGEQHSLNLKEKVELINELVSETELIDNMEILFGISAIRQKEAEELAKEIRETKISGIMLGYPPYILPSQEEALVYTKRITDLSNKPTILYNNPKRTGFDLSVKSMIELSEIDLVVGVKEAGNKEKVGLLKKGIRRSDFYFYAGGEVELEENVSLGFNRLSSIAGNIYPMEISQIFQKMITQQHISKQDRATFYNIIEQVYQGTPIVNLKKELNQKGIPIGICRSPIGNA